MTQLDVEFHNGYIVLPHVGSVMQGKVTHQFCGEAAIPFPDCPNCGKPLLHVMTCNLSDPQLSWIGLAHPFLPFVYCWRCKLSHEPFYYKLLPDGNISISKFGQGDPVPGFPYDNYPDQFERLEVIMAPLTSEEQAIIKAINRWELDILAATRLCPWLFDPFHQIGGEPRLLQGVEDIIDGCLECDREMEIIASFSNSNLHPHGFAFVDNVQMLYFFCRECKMIQVVNRID